MEEILVRGCRFLDGREGDVHISEGRIAPEGGSGGIVIEGKDRLALPGLCNTHTHAPMSLLRGVGEGLDLDRWLREAIWPMEARMTDEWLRAGIALSCLEMVRTGTTLFNDMYFREDELAPVVTGIGLRAVLGEGLLDNFSLDRLEIQKGRIPAVNDRIAGRGKGLVLPASAPHSVYTVSDKGLSWAAGEAARIGGRVHVHASETEREVKDCLKRTFETPVQHLQDKGLLGPLSVLAHSVHLSDADLKVLSSTGASVSLNPTSNMKLGSGGPPRYPDLAKAHVNVTLGTDGPASNNSLSMIETMKTFALYVRSRFGAPSITPSEVIRCATVNGYRALGVPGGSLEPGMVGDLILIDLKHHSMVPGNDIPTNVVFSMSPEAVTHTIVNGKVLMDDGKIEGASRIVEAARKAASDLTGRDVP
jgi:5-methylthioadenosine/S-adenosylhomocysteine deaminase